MQKLEASLAYTFRDPGLLRLALTHRSFVYESSPPELRPTNGRGREGRNPPGSDNEQLEFLGDAVLGLAVTELLLREFPDRSEGELTRLRAALVSRERLAALGAQLQLPAHLLLGRSAEQNGAREQPAVLADLTEAVLAAIYLDARSTGEEGLPAVRTLLQERLLGPALSVLREALNQENGRGALRDFKTLLQERVQAGNAGRLVYVDIAQEGPPHQRRFTVEARLEAAQASAVLGSAEGASKKEAQQRAAQTALEAWPPSLLSTVATGAAGERSA